MATVASLDVCRSCNEVNTLKLNLKMWNGALKWILFKYGEETPIVCDGTH